MKTKEINSDRRKLMREERGEGEGGGRGEGEGGERGRVADRERTILKKERRENMKRERQTNTEILPIIFFSAFNQKNNITTNE